MKRLVLRMCVPVFTVLAACSQEPTTSSWSGVANTQGASDFSYELIVTDVGRWAQGTDRGLVKDVEGPIAKTFDRFISGAQRQLSLAFYGVDHQSWFLERVEHKAPSVVINAVVDQKRGNYDDWEPDNFDYADTAKLAEVLGSDHVVPDVNPNGQPRASTIMHNKFAVVDRKDVWTGSMNLSRTSMGTSYNADLALIVRSPEVAEWYLAEHKQMFADKRFSIAKRLSASRKTQRFTDGTEVSVFFSPQDTPVESAVIPFIDSAKSTLDIAMFFLTHADIVDALAAAKQRGVKVRVINDSLAAAHPSSVVRALRAAGISVKVENWGGKMHMKAAVADGASSLIGSMNWTAAGTDDNDENTMVIRNNKKLAKELGAVFQKLWLLIPEYNGQDPRAEGPQSINSCADGLDNNMNGRADANDSVCRP